MTAAAILQLMGYIPQLIAAGVSAVDAYKQVRDKADVFVKEDRDPTPAEWAELNASLDAHTRAFEAAVAARDKKR